jgi:hypothetical protein
MNYTINTNVGVYIHLMHEPGLKNEENPTKPQRQQDAQRIDLKQ